jgi:hypothetical protein
LQRLREIFRQRTIDDPAFGKLGYHRGSRAWEGALIPPFAEIEVGLVVEAGEVGPTEQQREFYRQLAARYPELRTPIEDVLLEMLQNWDASIGREEVWTRFTLESMSIPRLTGDDRSWEFCYTLSGDPHYF